MKNITNSSVDNPESFVESVLESVDLMNVESNLQHLKDELAQKSRTAKLWTQYIKYIDILKHFITAERTRNWTLHLVTISRLIHVFAATGHINYAKSARLHLQYMLELSTKYPWVYSQFSEHGYHTVRRSDRYWSGLWSDLIIEQVLMSRSGITRGRGVSESVRLLWVNSMHRCAGIHNAMGNLTGHRHRKSKQHIELSTSRIKRDNSNLQKLIELFDNHEPFDPDEHLLKSLSSGITASPEDGVNCDEAEEVG